MALSPEQLSSSIKGLKRAPAPKVPGASSGGPIQAGPIDLNAIKLRKTGKRESLIEEDFMACNHEKENSPNEHNFKNRLAMFEHQENAPEKHSSLPRVMPKPKYRKTSEGSEDEKVVTKSCRQSFPQSEGTTDDNSNIVPQTETPTMKPLPSLQSIGKIPPPKPTKPLILVMKVQKRYKNHKVIIAPKIEPLAEAVENGRDEGDSIEEGEDIYDDICSAEETSPRPQPKLPTEPEAIEEEMYDDVEQLAETVKAELKGTSAQTQQSKNEKQGQGAPQHLNTTTSDVEPISDDFYDDCNSSQPPPFGGTTSVNDEEGGYGEDLYEGVDAIQSELANGIDENEDEKMKQEKIQQPPGIRPSNKEDDLKKREKEKKEKEKKEKELQKKKEKEEQRRKKEEEKQEREKKKKEEEERRRREKFDKELKKVHKLKGNEDVITKGTANEDFAGTGKDIPCAKGTVLEVILKENCPSGKWLIRNPQGHLGYVPSTILEVAAEESGEMLDEDLYECVDTFKSQDPPPQPPVSSNPPSNPVDGQEDIYDDTVMEDEDLYDDIPGA